MTDISSPFANAVVVDDPTKTEDNPFANARVVGKPDEAPFKGDEYVRNPGDNLFGGLFEDGLNKLPGENENVRPDSTGMTLSTPSSAKENIDAGLSKEELASARAYEQEMYTSSPQAKSIMDSPEYKSAKTPEERREILTKGLAAYNDGIYESKGEEGLFGRRQQLEDSEGNLTTEFIPPPGASPFMRTVRGIGSDLVQKGGSLLEKGIDVQNNIFADTFRGNWPDMVKNVVKWNFTPRFSDYKLPGLDDVGITNSDTDYFAEKYPREPMVSEFEKVIRPVASILVGALVGTKGVGKLDEVAEVSKKLTPTAQKFIQSDAGQRFFNAPIIKYLNKFKGVDAAKNPKRVEEGINRFLKEYVGASVGAAVMTPKAMDPLIGDDVLEFLGFSAQDNQTLGHYVDNVAMSSLGGLVIKTAKAGGGAVLNKVAPFFSSVSPVGREAEAAMLFIKAIDADIPEGNAVILAARARIMGEVVEKNSTFELGLFGQTSTVNEAGETVVENILKGDDLTVDSVTALATGIEEYVDSAYRAELILKNPTWDDAKIAKELVVKANSILSKVAGIKATFKNSDEVATADAAVNRGANAILTSVADASGGAQAAVESAQVLAGELVEPIRSSLGKTAAATQVRNTAEQTADMLQKNDPVLGSVASTTDSNPLGSSRIIDSKMNTLFGPEYEAGVNAAKKEVDDLFKAIPDDIPVDPTSLQAILNTLKAETNGYATITLNDTAADGFSATLAKIENMVDVAINEDGLPLNLKQLYAGTPDAQGLRPALSEQINRLQAKGQNNEASKLAKVKNWIDLAAKQSGEPAFPTAMEAHTAFVGKFKDTQPLAAQAKSISDVIPTIERESLPSTDTVRLAGQVNAYESSKNLITAMEQASTSGGSEAILSAVSSAAGRDVTPEVAEYYMNKVLLSVSTATSAGTKISSQQVQTAVAPYLAILERTSPETIESLSRTVKRLREAEEGIVMADGALASEVADYTELVRKSQDRAASKFVYQLAGDNPRVLDTTDEAWGALFRGQNSHQKVLDLIDQAEKSSNPVAVQGITAKYVAHIQDRIFTARKMAPDAKEGAVTEVSPAVLQKMLDSDFDTTLSTLRAVYKDAPEKADAVVRLLELMNQAANGNFGRSRTFSADSVVDPDLKKKVDRLILFSLGMLNPAATKARSINSSLTDGAADEAVEVINTHVKRMLADAGDFKNYMRAGARKADPTMAWKVLSLGWLPMDKALLGAYKANDLDAQTRSLVPSTESPERAEEDNLGFVPKP